MKRRRLVFCLFDLNGVPFERGVQCKFLFKATSSQTYIYRRIGVYCLKCPFQKMRVYIVRIFFKRIDYENTKQI